MKTRSVVNRGALVALAAMPVLALAQAQQVVKPPIASYWMSVETSAGMGIPGMGAMGSAMMGMMGGGAAQGGRRMHLQLGSQQGADAPRAEHAIPAGLEMGPMLPLLTPTKPKPVAREGVMPYERERPKGRMLIYWGCGDETRKGQPVVLDFAKLAEGQMPPNMVAHRVSAPNPPSQGRNKTYGDWPNAEDGKRVPDKASLRGDHVVKGNYSPEIRFALGEGHDFMPAVALAGAARESGARNVTWSAVPNATGYFATVFGAMDENEIVFWSSSEVQEMGSQLMDYVPPAEVARLVREKVVLPPSSTECAVPAEVVRKAGGTPMMSFIAYGPEANFVEPPRPKDPKIAWEQVWTAKARFKSTAMLMLGDAEKAAENPAGKKPADAPPASAPDLLKEGIKGLRGILGR